MAAVSVKRSIVIFIRKYLQMFLKSFSAVFQPFFSAGAGVKTRRMLPAVITFQGSIFFLG